MNESNIIQYLHKNGVKSSIVAHNLAEKIMKYDDIKQELMEWLATGEFRDDGLKVEGYGAKDIAKLAPFMNGIGVYNFMVDLRERPEEAKRYIEEGFPVL